MRLCRFTPAELFAEWQAIRESHEEYLRIAVGSGRISPYRRWHCPEVVEYLESALDRDLPRPAYDVNEQHGDTPSPTVATTTTEPARAYDAPLALFGRVDYTTDQLVNTVATGAVALPELQRPFVWDRSKVRDLFDSMYRGFPVGFLMLWSNQELQPSKTIGTNHVAGVTPNYLVVDGQQRLTSLFAVMNGSSVVNERFEEERIEVAFRPRDSRFAVADAAIRRDPEYIPSISALWAPGFGAYQFISGFLGKLKSAKSITAADEDAISGNITRLINLKNYPLTALVVNADASEENVADIFVRINNQGVKLEQSDFILTMLSVFWPEGRKQLEAFSRSARIPPANKSEASAFNHIIQPSPDQMLRSSIAVGFHRGRLRAVYQILRGKDAHGAPDPAALRAEQFARLQDAQPKVLNLDNWHAFLHTIRSAGFVNGDMVSSENSLVFCYSLYLIAKHQCGMQDPALSRTIRRWFFASILTGRYTGSVESTMDEDLAALREAKSPEDFLAFADRVMTASLPGDFWRVTLPTALETSSSRAPEFLAFLASQSLLNAPVLFSDKQVRDLMDPALRPPTKSVEMHHLFPKGWLKHHGVTSSRRINQVANLTLLEWPKNRSLSNLPPSQYVPRVKEDFTSSAWQTMASLHALPEGWQGMEYEHFLEARRRLMANMIREGFSHLDDIGGAEPTLVPMGDEKVVWPAIEKLERQLRRLVRLRYEAAWGATTDARMRATLGEHAWATIVKNREKHLSAQDPASVAGDVLDYCYLGQLGQLMMSNAAWSHFQEFFGNKQELTYLLGAITPVRNDLAHFRRVSQHELDKCRVSATELIKRTAAGV